jgi:hypothetical protein
MEKRINKDLIENIKLVRKPMVDSKYKIVKIPVFKRLCNFIKGVKSEKRVRYGSRYLFFNIYFTIGELNWGNENFIKMGVVYKRPHIVVKMSSGNDYTKYFISLKDMDKWLYDNVGDLRLITILS